MLIPRQLTEMGDKKCHYVVLEKFVWCIVHYSVSVFLYCYAILYVHYLVHGCLNLRSWTWWAELTPGTPPGVARSSGSWTRSRPSLPAVTMLRAHRGCRDGQGAQGQKVPGRASASPTASPSCSQEQGTGGRIKRRSKYTDLEKLNTFLTLHWLTFLWVWGQLLEMGKKKNSVSVDCKLRPGY